MEWLKRNYKTVTGTLVILILIEIVLAWYLIDRFRENYLSGSEALAIAMEHAGEAPDSAPEASIRLRTRHGSAWYDISWESVDAVHQYMVDAETGEILSTEPK